MKRISRNLSGMVFGRLTVIEFSGTVNGKKFWKCECGCIDKTITSVQEYHLINGHTRSCGCLIRERASNRTRHNLVGKTFGRLRVIRLSRINESHNQVWMCVCDCGNETEVIGTSLTTGVTRSCGCYWKERISQSNTTHGMSKTKEYKSVINSKRLEMKAMYDYKWTTDMEIVLRRFFNSCPVCGGNDRMSTAHVYPLSLGCGLEPGNAIRLCVHCNSRQSDRTPENLPSSFPEGSGERMLKAAREFKEYWESLQK